MKVLNLWLDSCPTRVVGVTNVWKHTNRLINTIFSKASKFAKKLSLNFNDFVTTSKTLKKNKQKFNVEAFRFTTHTWDPFSYMLFDCDEGTLQQLNRKFGYEKTLEILKNLTAIYISHLHADHQMGFIGIVQQREAGLLTDDFNQIWSLTQLYFVYFSQIQGSV